MVVIRVSRHSETRRKSLRQSPCITTRQIVSPTSAQHFGSREQHSTAILLTTKLPTIQVEADKDEARRPSQTTVSETAGYICAFHDQPILRQIERFAAALIPRLNERSAGAC